MRHVYSRSVRLCKLRKCQAFRDRNSLPRVSYETVIEFPNHVDSSPSAKVELGYELLIYLYFMVHAILKFMQFEIRNALVLFTSTFHL